MRETGRPNNRVRRTRKAADINDLRLDFDALSDEELDKYLESVSKNAKKDVEDEVDEAVNEADEVAEKLEAAVEDAEEIADVSAEEAVSEVVKKPVKKVKKVVKKAANDAEKTADSEAVVSSDEAKKPVKKVAKKVADDAETDIPEASEEDKESAKKSEKSEAGVKKTIKKIVKKDAEGNIVKVTKKVIVRDAEGNVIDEYELSENGKKIVKKEKKLSEGEAKRLAYEDSLMEQQRIASELVEASRRKERTRSRIKPEWIPPVEEEEPAKFGFLYLPVSLAYLEIAHHLYMRMDMKYILIYTFFAFALGMLATFFTRLFPAKVAKVLTYILVIFNSVVIGVEMMCKIILSQYFQLFSVMDTAANNHLTDYKSAIIEGIKGNILGILLMLVPLIVLIIFGNKFMNYERLGWKRMLIAFGTVVVCAACAFGSMFIPYGGAKTPWELYNSDINVEDQVEQLGVMTMIGQDMVHSVFGVSRDTTVNQDEFDDINNLLTITPSPSPEPTPSPEPVGPTSTPAPTPTPVDRSPNVLNIDFDAMEEETKNDSVHWLNKYLSSRAPTEKNEYTGMFKDYNVIFITAEGFTGRVIDKDLTPTLYKMLHEGFYFPNYYNVYHYASTTGGECMNLLGMYPKDGEPQTMSYIGDKQLTMPYTLVGLLSEQGYTSKGYHFNSNMYNRRKSHTQLGYDYKDAKVLPLEKHSGGNSIWPQSDVWMVDNSFDDYINCEPFNVYYLTISGHMPYSDGGSYIASKNYERVKDLEYSRPTKDYIAAQLELEDAMKDLIDKLDNAGVLDHTLIVLAPDHIPYFDVPVIEELAGEKFGSSADAEYVRESKYNLEVYKSNCIIWSASMEEPVVCEKVCDSVDVLPTVLNLMGVPYDSRMIEGQDILSTTPGLVVSATHCWWTDEGFYNIHSKEFRKNDGCTLEGEELDNYIRTISSLAEFTTKTTVLVQETNYFSLVKYKEEPDDGTDKDKDSDSDDDKDKDDGTV